jgi:hypothetical protein
MHHRRAHASTFSHQKVVCAEPVRKLLTRIRNVLARNNFAGRQLKPYYAAKKWNLFAQKYFVDYVKNSCSEIFFYGIYTHAILLVASNIFLLNL